MAGASPDTPMLNEISRSGFTAETSVPDGVGARRSPDASCCGTISMVAAGCGRASLFDGSAAAAAPIQSIVVICVATTAQRPQFEQLPRRPAPASVRFVASMATAPHVATNPVRRGKSLTTTRYRRRTIIASSRLAIERTIRTTDADDTIATTATRRVRIANFAAWKGVVLGVIAGAIKTS